jgi:hypothetical protein
MTFKRKCGMVGSKAATAMAPPCKARPARQRQAELSDDSMAKDCLCLGAERAIIVGSGMTHAPQHRRQRLYASPMGGLGVSWGSATPDWGIYPKLFPFKSG